MRRLSLILLFLFLINCQETKEWLNNWQKKQVEKRYGKVNKRDKLPDWQKDVEEYEEIIDQKIKAGINAAKVYRKLGESYAEFEMYTLCEKNIKKAINLGLYSDEVFYQLGLCQGNRASSLNWPVTLTQETVKTFLRVLKKNPKFDKAKYQLSIIYFYGMTKHNKYSILNDIVTVSQKKIRKKAILLMKEYQLIHPEDKKSYFALAGFYSHTGLTGKAAKQMLTLMNLFQQKFPLKYSSDPSYIQAQVNYRQLTSSSKKSKK